MKQPKKIFWFLAPALRWTGVGFGLATMMALSGILAIETAAIWEGLPRLNASQDISRVVLDRNGQLLRAFTTNAGRWRLPLNHNDVDQRYLEMLFAFEDRRFFEHNGVDYLALARAGLQFARNGRVVSGASTLTMQVARLIDGRRNRSLTGKIRQIVRARQLERNFSKHELLDVYLRLAPFGGNIEGARAASLAYFGKEPSRLSVGQAALLVALPQSPEARRPDRYAQAARIARDRVIDRVVKAGLVSDAEARRARGEKVPHGRRPFPMFAPHLAEKEVRSFPNLTVHKLTIDRKVQKALEALARDHVKLFGDKLSAAVLVVENATGEVIAQVGSADYLNESRNGPIDMVHAIRSPGSTLKPFIYGLGFEAGFAHPETLIEDRPARFGRYAPKNFNQDYRGTISVREALAQSVNVPAIKVLDAVGPHRLVARMEQAGAQVALPKETEPSLAVGLGGVGLRLYDLATLYVSLSNGGRYTKLTHRQGARARRVLSGDIAKDNRKRFMTPVAAWYVTDILKDAPAPDHARSGRIAYKTGTSYGYRDALAVGFDGKHSVAVWVGRADGTSVPGLVGRKVAAPILFDAFARLSSDRAKLPGPPSGTLQVSFHELPPPLQRFRRTQPLQERGPYRTAPVVIAFPPDRSEIEVTERAQGHKPTAAETSPVVLKAEGGVLPLTWLVDGKALPAQTRQAFWTPNGIGFSKLTVIDANGRVDRVNVRIKLTETDPDAIPRGKLRPQP